MPTAGRMAMSQKISSHRWSFIQFDHGPMALSSTKFTSDHDPEAIPDIIAACSRGNAYDPTFSATIWKPPPMNVEKEINAIAAGTEVVHVVIPSVRDAIVSRRNMPIGRGLLAANLSAAQPQKK